MSKKSKPSISLLASQSAGGEYAQDGFEFQNQVVLTNIPQWLNQDGFTSFIQESAGDVECKFFIPGFGYQRIFLEIKDHQITPSEFWEEIERFQILDSESPGTYQRFTLVAPNLSKVLHPLVNGLQRLRGPHGFYDEDSEIWKISYEEYRCIIIGMGGADPIANFIYRKVFLDTGYGEISSGIDGLFIEELLKYFQEYNFLPGVSLQQISGDLKNVLRKNINKVVTRGDLVTTIIDSIPTEQCPPIRPITLFTSKDSSDRIGFRSLHFNWSTFWGGQNRVYPLQNDWNQKLVKDLLDVRQWILDYGNTRHIKLVGSRRLSATLALGHVFSSVAGFIIDMEYREGKIWSTNNFPTETTPHNDIESRYTEGSGNHLVLSISFLRDIACQVKNSLEELDLNEHPWLEIIIADPVVTPEQANKTIQKIKSMISGVISRNNCEQIHLFFAGPSPLALFLGHRLNATAPVQCYEWTSINMYVPTCTLV